MADSDFQQPFEEMLAALEKRLGNQIQTERWTDLLRNAHDRSFTVAGATEADLLSDLADAVGEAISEGQSIEQFRQNFDQAVEEYGWDFVGERNWRTRVIYQTNMATSYAAGRLAQLKDPDLIAAAPYWMYRHGGSADPRPQHVAWDGLVRRHDDPWWSTHYPPNDWGCSCYVIAVSREQAERMGGRFEAPPEDEPGDIGPGWDYQPGRDVADELRDLSEQKMIDLPGPLAEGFAERMRGREDSEDRPVTIRPQINIESGTARQKLRDLQALGADIRPLMQAIGEVLVDSTKQRFQASESPDGQPWAPNTETTLLNHLGRYKSSFGKRGKLTQKGAGRVTGKKPLIGETKSLSRTINYRLAGNTLKLGSPMVYAATQQFGAKKGQFGTNARGRPIPWGDIPARRFLGLSDNDRTTIRKLTREHLGERD